MASVVVKVQDERSGRWVRLPLPTAKREDAKKVFRDVGAEISRRFEMDKFSLHWHPREVAEQTPEPPLEHVTAAEWGALVRERRASGVVTLLARPAGPASPASWVDPFWACERTDLPQLKGIAAAWYWPKALQGNAHPGATLPFNTVSIIPFSGAYPSGYGLNSGASGGIPELLRARNGSPDAPAETQAQRDAMPPQQYTTVGFTHFQASGTGSIGNYMNYMKTLPLPMSGDAFVAAGKGLNSLRHTIVGERAEPGRYACVLAESNIAAEVTAGPSVACHRYTTRSSWSEPATGGPPQHASPAGCMVVDFSAAGLLVDFFHTEQNNHTQTMVGIKATITASGTVEGTLSTPTATGQEATSSGLELHFSLSFAVDGGGAKSNGKLQFYPKKYSGTKSLSVSGDELAAMCGNAGTGVGIVIDNDGRPGAFSNTTGMRLGFSLRDIATARANVTAVDNLSFDEVLAASWREWDGAMSRIAVLDDPSTPAMQRELGLFYSTLYHSMKKPTDFTGQVPADWTIDGKPDSGYVFDLGTMWDQYKFLLPLIVSVWPDTMGKHLVEGLCALAKRFGEFPTGYTMDTSTERFDGQAIGLAHHVLGDAYYRKVEIGINWEKDVLPLMHQTFTHGEGLGFAQQGRSPSNDISHTLDLCGAALATSLIAQGAGDKATAAAMLKLTDNFENVYDKATGLLSNKKEDAYYEGTYVNYSFRQLPDMEKRIALCPGGEKQFMELMDDFFGFGADGTPKPPVVQAAVNTVGKQEWGGASYHAGESLHTFEGLCNEPDMEAPMTFAYAGRLDRLAEVITACKTYSFSPGRGGVCGNLDSGGEAGWYVWAALGIHPVPGQPIYIISVPTFATVHLRLGPTTTLQIQRVGSGAYVQSGTLAGSPLNGRGWLHVSEVHEGAAAKVLRLTMGATPNPEWGAQRPPSFKPT